MLIAEKMLIHVTDIRDPTYGMLHCIQDTTALPNRPVAIVSLLVDQEELQLQSVNQQQCTRDNIVFVHYQQEQNHYLKDLHTNMAIK